MINLPKLSDIDVSGKRVIVRMDFDLPAQAGTPEGDFTRIESSKPTLEYLLQKNSKLILIGHKGRPEGVRVDDLSLRPIAQKLGEIVGKGVTFSENFENAEGQVVVYENLRFDPRESFDPAQDAGAEEFVRQLASLGEVYVNEAFAVSHRAHASIVGIPKFLPHAAGFRFVQEIEHLEKVIENPVRPLVFLISGIKKDKLEMIEAIKNFADKVLVAGRLPEYLEDVKDEKLLIAHLNPDKEDITIRSIEDFEKEVLNAKTIVLAGVIGKYEDEGHMLGTERVFKAVAESSAYKVAGGGDTEAALTTLNLTEKFDWISVGGGAMLEFLAKRTLPGIEVLLA